MRICGVALDSSAAIVAVIDTDATGNVILYETDVRKVLLTDHEDASSLRDFSQTMTSFVRDASIDRLIVRRCTYKGKYVSGAAAIKMEALLQLIAVPVELVSPHTIHAARKKIEVVAPGFLKAYQHDAFDAALAGAHAKS
jgi:hypothetical protein